MFTQAASFFVMSSLAIFFADSSFGVVTYAIELSPATYGLESLDIFAVAVAVAVVEIEAQASGNAFLEINSIKEKPITNF